MPSSPGFVCNTWTKRAHVLFKPFFVSSKPGPAGSRPIQTFQKKRIQYLMYISEKIAEWNSLTSYSTDSAVQSGSCIASDMRT